MGYVTMKWLFALLLGIGTASISFFINVVVEHLAGFKFRATLFLLRFSSLLAFLFYAAANTALVCSSAVIVSGYAPAAAGSGIPEIKGYLNGIDSPGLLLVRTLVGKIFGSIGSVAGGLALGKEGPLVHIGACLASLLGQGGSAHHRLSGRWVAAFQNDRDRRDLVTCGAAAGAAAAFRAPVGGVLFAMEEATSWWRPTLTWRVFFTSAVVSVVLRALMRGGGGEGFIIWDVHGGQADYTAFELLPMAMLGVAGGLAGALFNRLSLTVSLWRRTSLHPRGARVKVYDACVVALITSTLSFGLPLLHNCTPCPALARPAPAAAMSNGNYVNVSATGCALQWWWGGVVMGASGWGLGCGGSFCANRTSTTTSPRCCSTRKTTQSGTSSAPKHSTSTPSTRSYSSWYRPRPPPPPHFSLPIGL